MRLLPEEQKAADFVREIGLPRAYRLISRVAARIQRRVDKANERWIVDESAIRRTPLEVSLMHRLKLGVGIVDDYFSPESARRRIQERLAKRKARRAERLVSYE